MWWRFSVLIVVLILLCRIQCSKILMVFNTPSYSHYAPGLRLGKELAKKGHEVTMISPYPQKTQIKNFEDISVVENIATAEDTKSKLFEMGKKNMFHYTMQLHEVIVKITEQTFENRRVQELLNSNKTFDVVVMEHFLNEAHVVFGYHFNAPIILLEPTSSNIKNNYIFGNPAPSSYVPNYLSEYTQHMNFWERTQNLIINTISDILLTTIYLPKQRKLFKKFTKTDLDLDDVLHNTSLMFINSHVSVNKPVPLVPNIIEIGGIHVYPPKKLPDDLQQFLDEAKDGVVLFSLGSNLQSKNLKPEVRKAILKALGKLKQKVLWKFETDLPETPSNVKIMNWLPQQDILAHPNVQAFISHGGWLSMIESVYYGVPVIGVPVFGDQKNNVAGAVHAGYAVTVKITELTEEKLTWALNEILNNPKYRQVAKQKSRVMNDRPLNPVDTAIYWTEHVIRHRGASHLRSSGIELRWYQRNLIDVFLFLMLVIVAFFVLILRIFKRIFALCIENKPKVEKRKKQ